MNSLGELFQVGVILITTGTFQSAGLWRTPYTEAWSGFGGCIASGGFFYYRTSFFICITELKVRGHRLCLGQGTRGNGFCHELVLEVSAFIPLECSGAGEPRGSQQLLGTARFLCPDKGKERTGTPTAYVLGVAGGAQAEAAGQGGIFNGATCLFKA